MFGKHGGIVGPDGGPLDSQGGSRLSGMPGGARIAIPQGMIEAMVETILSDLKILEKLSMIDARTKAILEHLGIPEPELPVEVKEEEKEETAQGK